MNSVRTSVNFTVITLLAGLLIFASTSAWAQSADFFPSISDKYQNVRVERVLSADTIMLEGGERVSLIGLKAPEAPRRARQERRDKYGFVIHEENPVTTIEEQAFKFAQNLLLDQDVRLEFDEVKKDAKFTTVAYVFLVNTGQFANAEILKQGYAALHIVAPNLKYADILRKAYQEARREKRGLQGQ